MKKAAQTIFNSVSFFPCSPQRKQTKISPEPQAKSDVSFFPQEKAWSGSALTGAGGSKDCVLTDKSAPKLPEK